MPHLTYASQTKYPEVFKNSYWGRFCNKTHVRIVSNRNDFAKIFKLQQGYHHENTPSRVFNIIPNIDHTEVYANENNYIIISSPCKPIEDYEERGFKKWAPLYNINYPTYIKVVNKKSANPVF